MRSLTVLAAFVAIGAGAYAASPVPRPAKELEIVEPSGKHDLLTSYRGKVVVVQFLFTTCPHCQAYSQFLTKLQKEYGPRGFQALGGAFNEANESMVNAYLHQYNVGFPIGPMARDTVLSFMGFSIMDRLVVPQIAVIDRKGMIVEQTEANPPGEAPLQVESHIRGLIEKLLAEGSHGAAHSTTSSHSAAAHQGAATSKKSVSVN